MDIFAKPGTRVRYCERAGHDCEIKHAEKHITFGEVYTVLYTDVHDWFTDVYLVEFGENISFNSVMFKEVDE